MGLSLATRAEAIRAVERARDVLEKGDRITFASCPGTLRTATFIGFAGNWIRSATRDDISARSIVKRNGEPISFRDPPWEHYDPDTGRPYGDHGSGAQAIEFAFEHIDDEAEAITFLGEWRTGHAWREWPEFYEWLDPWPAQRARRRDGRLAAADL